MELPIELVVPSPINVRREVGDVSELAESIREQGILEPLVVRPTQDGKYEVIIGSRRLASANQVGLQVVPVVVQDISDADAIVRSLVENLQRGDLSLEDRVEAYKRLQDIDGDRFGTTQSLARSLGRNRPSIVRDFEAYEALVRLRPSGVEVVHNIPPSSAQRKSREAIPESHATLLEQAMMAVRGRLPEDMVEDTYTAVARAIAPLEQDRARRLLDYFKMYPERPVAEIESMAFATVERSVTLDAATARQLDELTGNEGTSNWDDAIARLIQQTQEPEQEQGVPQEDEGIVVSLPYDALQKPLVENMGVGSEDEEEGEAEPDYPSQSQLSRPLRLPESPERVQRYNKEIWNVEHLPVKADFYTIGYAGRDIEQFVSLLQAVGVSTLVDIRENPVSQYKPDFSKENLRGSLAEHRIKYIHKAEWGVPLEIRSRSVEQKTRDSIWAWYDDNVISAINNGELSEFREQAEPPLAFMCVEMDLTACHRHLLFLALEKSGLRGFDL